MKIVTLNKWPMVNRYYQLLFYYKSKNIETGVEKLKSKKELYLKIESLKIRMIQTSNEKGMNHPLTIQISQKLDRLINEYMKLTQQK